MSRRPIPPERVQLTNDVFEGRNNTYLLGTDTHDLALVDTGMATSGIHRQLEEGLRESNRSFEDVDVVVLTHFHADHAGLAGAVQAASDATVYAHALDAPLIENDEEAWGQFESRRRAYLDAWGMPDEKQAALREYMFSFPDQPEPAPTVTPVTEGDVIEAGGCELAVTHLPGHTQGQLGLFREGSAGRELFTGDALLPYYTPNVGGADVRSADPLAEYIDTLCAIVDADPVVAHPGHRNPIEDPAGRAMDIIRHHRDRTARVINALENGGALTAWEISAALFGELHEIHILHGPGEVHAHLRHLLNHDAVEETEAGWVVVGDPDPDAMFPAVAP